MGKNIFKSLLDKFTPVFKPKNITSNVWYTNQPLGDVKVYSSPASISLHPDFKVVIKGKNSPVYATKGAISYNYQWPGPPPDTETIGFSNFDISGAVDVIITVSNRTLRSARVFPTIYGVKTIVSGNTIKFTIAHPGKYEILLNGSERKALYLFANPMEVNAPTKSEGDTTYYGPGVHDIGKVELGWYKNVYIAPGAIVYGQFIMHGNNKIFGRGILDCSKFATHDGHPILVYGENHTIEGITINDSPGWNVSIWGAKNVIVDNIKIFSYRQNSDGIDVVSAKNVRVKNVFIKNWDDGITVKANGGEVVDDVIVSDSVLSTDFGGRTLGVGAETVSDYIQNVLFDNIDLLHTHSHSALGVENSDRADVRNITFKNIRIRNHHGFSLSGYSGEWLSLMIVQNFWSTTGIRGKISNIVFENITFETGQQMPTIFTGYDSNSIINVVKLINVKNKLVKIMDENSLMLTKKNTSNITFL